MNINGERFESFFHGMDSLHKEMNLLFDDFWKGGGRPSLTNTALFSLSHPSRWTAHGLWAVRLLN
jgi:hypothetical protein